MALLTESMTQIFTPPAECSTSWTYEGSYYNSVRNGLLLQNAMTANYDCFPSGFRNSGRSEGNQIFSPGYCADGYTSAALNFDGSTTTAVCCPSDFSYYTTLTTPNGFDNTMMFAGCVSTYPMASPATAVLARAGNFDTTTSTVSGPITMWAQPMTVAYEEDDLSLFITTTTTTTTPTTTPTSTERELETPSSSNPTTSSMPSSTETNATNAPPSTDGSSSKLSTGAKAGIGAGAAAGGLIIIALLFLLYRRSRQNNAENAASPGINGYQPGAGAPHYPYYPHNISEVAGYSSPEGFIPEMEDPKSRPSPYSNVRLELPG
ncbi:hypothetical protein BDW59DRAFT_158057 [Aspergillus cavernicola]|uniref:Mid2 domain-containing protein n=1 Tax=Aspergillus cavernicola TaxID=176166 RepID=A0ABR4ITL2_9EURO